MAFIPNSNSVVAFQSDPTKLVGTVSVVGSPTQIAGSILAVNFPSPSTISYQLAGSILAVSGSFSATPQGSITAMQSAGSVMAVRTDNASVLAVLANSSVTALQGTNPWLVNVPSPSTIAYQLAGSVLAVSGSFSANPQSSIIATQIAGSILAVNFPSPSIIAYQAAGSIMAVSATVNTGNSSVQLLAGVAAIGSVTALQGTNPWQINVPSPSTIAYQLAGSIMAVSGSFSSGNTSVQLLGGNAAIGSVTALQGTNPWLIGNNSVLAFQGTTPWIINSILGTYQEKNAVTASVFGIPTLFKIDETNSVLSAVSPQSPLPVRGSVTALQGTNPWIVNMPSPSIIIITPAGSVQGVRTDNASVIAVLSNSSVTALQGTNPWIVNMPSPSVVATQIAGSIMAINMPSPSVIAIQAAGSIQAVNMPSPSVIALQQAGSIMAVSGIAFTISSVTLLGGSVLGTYADNSAWVEGNIGLYGLAVRNDTMSSVSAADVRFSPQTVGPVGETIVANAPITKWVRGVSSVFTGTSVQLIAPQGASIFTYITGLQVTNASANNVYLTFTGGLGGITSTLGYAPAPANGGAIIPIPNAWITGANSGFSASVSGVASIYLTAQGFISKT